MDPDARILSAFFGHLQARPKDLAQQILGPQLHFRSLANAMRHIRSGLEYVTDALWRWEDDEWPAVEDIVAQELSSSTMFLAGVLDGMVILEATLLGQSPSSSMSFERTPFRDGALRDAQTAAKGLRSRAQKLQPVEVDFWTLANYWKHYFPYQRRPSHFERSGGVRDISVALGEGCNSGPVMRDLLVPVYNLACDMMQQLAGMPGVQEPFDFLKLPVVV